MNSNDLAAQNRYFQTRLDELTGLTIKADARLALITRELRQRRDALALLSILQRTITTDLHKLEVYRRLLNAMRSALKMDIAMVLEPCESEGLTYQQVSVSGAELNPDACIDVHPVILSRDGFVLATRTAELTPFIAQARDHLGLAFFVAVPVYSGDAVCAILISGRQRERKPFSPPLDEQDVNTMASMSGFLGMLLTNTQLYQTQLHMSESFRRFVPQQFLEILGRDSIVDVGMGEQVQRRMTILFSDIRSFTKISESMSPEANFNFINHYLEFVAPAVIENGGFIDKYISDAIMALFPGDIDSAVSAAIGLHSGLARFNQEWSSAGHPPIKIGVGLHTGLLMLGTIGFKERMDTTVIADAVNLASRMEGLTKQYGASILITDSTRSSLARPDDFLMRTVDRVMVKGKNEPVNIVEVFNPDCDEQRQLKIDSLPLYQQAIQDCFDGRFQEAQSAFETISSRNPLDGAASLLAARCGDLLASGPPLNWCGIVAMEK